MKKKCAKCGLVKPLADFHRQGDGNSGRNSKCKKCIADYSKGYRANQKPKFRALYERRIAVIRSIVQAAKDVPCTDCGNEYPSFVMDFDHRPDEIKLFSIGGRQTSIERLVEEIAKCDVVCANCHRIRTFTRLFRSDGSKG